ncbi:MAG: sulfatase-like hydrolase/transferase, partial [Verrucomicrobiota bacterium]
MTIRLLFCLTAFSIISHPELEAARQPNVIFIYTDDQAPLAAGAAGDARFVTPHIDRLFHEGAHLTRSFVTSPVCSPSRAGL